MLPAFLLRTLLLATLAGVGRSALRRLGRGHTVSALALGFLSALFALKAVPLLGPRLGLLRSDFLFPLWALWSPADGAWWLAVGMFLPAGLAIAVVSERAGRLSTPSFLAGAGLLAIAFWISLSLSNGGFPEGLISPFERQADYYADVARFASLADIWSGYTGRQEGLSLHGRTHPPGAVAILFLLDRATGSDLRLVCLAVVMLGATTLLPLHEWARLLLGTQAARLATLLWIVTPAVALYGATCMDMIFAVPLVTAGWLYHRGLVFMLPTAGAVWRTRTAAADLVRGGLAGLALGTGLLLTFAAGLLALVFALQSVLLARATSSTRPFRLLAAVAGVAALVLGAARLAGFNWVACASTAVRLDAAEASAFLSARYYVLTRLMGALDFLVLSGVALAPAWLHVLRHGVRALDTASGRDTAPILIAGARAAAAAGCLFLIAGAFKIGETGRIGLFLLPFMLLPVCRGLSAFGPPRRAALALAAWGASQALVFEAFLDTRW